MSRQDIVRHGVAARYSEAAVFNGVVYLAGMVPERGDTDIRGQTEDVLAQVVVQLTVLNGPLGAKAVQCARAE